MAAPEHAEITGDEVAAVQQRDRAGLGRAVDGKGQAVHGAGTVSQAGPVWRGSIIQAARTSVTSGT